MIAVASTGSNGEIAVASEGNLLAHLDREGLIRVLTERLGRGMRP
jgi:hypothetical protein